MIAVMGDACLLFRQVENDLFRCDVSGYGYRVASALAHKGVFPALFSPLGSDRAASAIVERMVSDEILFDPEISNLPLKTGIMIEYLDGQKIDLTSSSAASALSSDLLGEALSVHTNIKCVHLSSRGLSLNPTASAFIDQSLFITPRPYIVVDLNEDSSNALLSRSIETLMPYADLFIAKKEMKSPNFVEYVLNFWDFENSSYVKLKNKTKKGSIGRDHCLNMLGTFKKGELVASEDVKNTDDETFASTLLYTLEKDFFPSADDDFSSYDVPLSILKEALRAL